MKTKTLFLFLVVFLASFSAYAQRPGGGRGRPEGGGPAICKVFGKVLDAQTKKAVPYATVTVTSMRNDSLVGGGLVQENGDFSVDKLRFGRYEVRVKFLGYKDFVQQVRLGREGTAIDMGNLSIEADNELLKEVEIVAEKNQAVLQVDRRVYNVDKDLSVRGGTAEDVMQNIPGLEVDSDGNVELRGRSPRIFVDGRPSLLTLEQIPADDIERVEVISNPSVLFDASSTGGILNVVLKKTTKPGYSGSIQAGIGSNGRYQTRGDLRIKEQKYTLSLSGSYNVRNRITDGFSNRRDFFNGEVIEGFDQDTENDVTSIFMNGRIGFDYKISNRNSFNSSVSYFGGAYETQSKQASITTDGFQNQLSSGLRTTDDETDFGVLSARLGFRHDSPKKGKYWTADLNYSGLNRNTTTSFNDRTWDLNQVEVDSLGNIQDSDSDARNGQIVFQFDHVNPFTDNKKFEWGVKGSYKEDNSRLAVTNTDNFGFTQRDTALSNDFEVTDIVAAAYGNYTTAIDSNWSVQAGLRFEVTEFEINLLETNESFVYSYPGDGELLNALFPAIYFSRKWGGERELQVNFSRKIERPNFWQVMPVIRSSDQRSIRIGEPTLAPEFSNLAEINHLLPFGKGNSWLSSIYTRITEDVITEFTTPFELDSTLLLTTYTNGETSFNYGWENTIRLKPTDAFDITLSGNIRWVDITVNSGDRTISNTGINWNGKASVKYKLSSDLSFQANGRFSGPRTIPQGERQGQYSLDLSVNKKIKRTWDFTVSLRDVFNSRFRRTVFDTPSFFQESQRRRDIRHVMFTATYRFGQNDASLFRRRGGGRSNQRTEPGRNDDGGDF